MSLEHWIGGIVAVALVAYLAFALVQPDRF
ncbi:K(+)-transporting ATPase subunit F [Vulgatibacter incomptus]|nr:K(+)-transporting ATPase subunit F [Vulgatibacter incomptus]